MYIRADHQLTDREALWSLMTARPLGTWVLQGEGGLVANHVPFYLDRERGPWGTLMSHVSRANPVWRELARASVVIFQGPQGYITPNWYPSKADGGRVVPTWDYAVAHAHGVARVVDEPEWMLALLNRLTDTHEAAQAKPWRVADAPPDYIARLMRGVVGIEIPIDRIDGKLKVSQAEALPDRLGTASGLRSLAGDEAQQLAALVQGAIDADEAKAAG